MASPASTQTPTELTRIGDLLPPKPSPQETSTKFSVFLKKRYNISWPSFPSLSELPRFLLYEILANWRAGVTVGLVSVPLSISLAIAADATPGNI
jgi:hypothetical protein